MQSVIVCVVLAVVPLALGHPTALEDSVLGHVRDNVDESSRWFPAERISEEEPKKILQMASKAEEDVKKINLMKDDRLAIPSEFLTGSEDKKKDELVETAKVESSSDVNIKQDDDSVRSKKSPDVREQLAYHQYPVTSVCIHVRNHDHPSVVCGPQVGNEKKEEKPAPSAPRFADFYSPLYLQELQGEKSLPAKGPQTFMRMSGTGMPQEKLISPVMISPKKMMTPFSPIMSQAQAAHNYAVRRTQSQTEDDNSVSQKEDPQPTVPIQPMRIIPQGPSPSPLVVHKQYYQAPIPHFHSNLITSLPSATPLRFNCALQPDGAQLVQTYGSPLVRTAATSGLLPLGGEMMTDMQGLQGFYINPQGRAVQSEDMQQFEDPWAGATFIAEDGQMYKIDDSQSRAAVDEQETSKATSGMTKLKDVPDKDDRIKLLEEKLNNLQRSMDESDKKKQIATAEPTKETTLPAKELPETEDHKKPMPSKNIKRHSYPHNMSQ